MQGKPVKSPESHLARIMSSEARVMSPEILSGVVYREIKLKVCEIHLVLQTMMRRDKRLMCNRDVRMLLSIIKFQAT